VGALLREAVDDVVAQDGQDADDAGRRLIDAELGEHRAQAIVDLADCRATVANGPREPAVQVEHGVGRRLDRLRREILL
jgi:hypothetical protein